MIPLVALAVKCLLIVNIKGNIWPGPDYESYYEGADNLIKFGIFSDAQILQYFPAGYPLTIWLFSKISLPGAYFLLSTFQSLVFFYATWYFVKNIQIGILIRISPLIALIISFNPTLSLSSLVIGYESLVASTLMISVGVLLDKNLKKDTTKIIIFAALNGFASFLQPRYLLVSVIVGISWLIYGSSKSSKKRAITVLLAISTLSPVILGFRNFVASDNFFVSKNLDDTMYVGIGKNATGGYLNDKNNNVGVACPPGYDSESKKIICYLSWYATNPLDTLRLSINKTIYFFSPWTGPLANGTMSRNPWQKINPIQKVGNNPETKNLILGVPGKVISWFWMISSFGLMTFGALCLWQRKNEERLMSAILSIPIAVSWLTSLGTIGDHRFRVPVLGFMCALQVIGASELVKNHMILKLNAKTG